MITDELREWAKRFDRAWFNGEGIITFSTFRPTAEDVSIREIVESIADRIDAEHEADVSTACRLAAGLDNDALAKRGYIKLPVDADGVSIHVGDRLDGYGKTIEVVELRYGRSGWVLISRDGNGYADTFAFTHHHTPTVEDVLREFFSRYVTTKPKDEDDAILAEYAAKLRLAGEDA